LTWPCGGYLGEDASLSASTVARLKEPWQAEWEAWRRRWLEDLEPVYLWADGGYVRAGPEKEKAAVLVVIVGWVDGRKGVGSVEPGEVGPAGPGSCGRPSGSSRMGTWGSGGRCGTSGRRRPSSGAGTTRSSTCWTRSPKPSRCSGLWRTRPAGRKQITSGRPSRRGAKGRTCKQAAQTLGQDWDRMVTFSPFPQEHRVHLRTVNVVESPFAALRLRTDAAKRSKRYDQLSAVIGKMLLVAERRFRRLNAPAPAREGLRRRAVRGWGRGSPGGRRLMRKSTPLDETSPEAASKRRTPPDRHQPRGGEL